MLQCTPDLGRTLRWQTLRRRIRFAGAADRLRLLERFGDEIRALGHTVAKEYHAANMDLGKSLEAAAAVQGAVVGAWLAIDPVNPTWPGRDRLFLLRREDLLGTCVVLAASGFFPSELIADMVEEVGKDGRRALVPGIEAPGAAPEEIPNLIWESAVESARSKKRWREEMGADAGKDWAEAWWRESPAVWRTCAILTATDAAAAQCRELPARGGDAPAGLVVFVKAPRLEAHTVADEWGGAGWETATVNRNDFLGLYELLITAVMDKPLAIILSVGETSKTAQISRTVVKRRESGLLGEMSDEQFNAIMGESLNL